MFLGTRIHVACGGVGWGGLITFLGTRIYVAMLDMLGVGGK